MASYQLKSDCYQSWQINDSQQLVMLDLTHFNQFLGAKYNYPENICYWLTIWLASALIGQSLTVWQRFHSILRSQGLLALARIQAHWLNSIQLGVAAYAEFDPQLRRVSADIALANLTPTATLFWQQVDINQQVTDSWLAWQGHYFIDALERLLQQQLILPYHWQVVTTDNLFKVAALINLERSATIDINFSSFTKHDLQQTDFLTLLRQYYPQYCYKLLRQAEIQWFCQCNFAQIRQTLNHIAVSELVSWQDEQKQLIVQCPQCGENYHFSGNEILKNR